MISVFLFIIVLAHYLPYQIKTFKNDLLNSYAKRIRFWAYFMLLSLLIALAGILGAWFNIYREILMNTVQIQNLIIQASVVGFFDTWFCVYRSRIYLKRMP